MHSQLFLLVFSTTAFARGISLRKPESFRAFDSPLDSIPCQPPVSTPRFSTAVQEKIYTIWKSYKGGDCWLQLARTRNILMQLTTEEKGVRNGKRDRCQAPEVVRALPERAQRRIAAIWQKRNPNGNCREQQRLTRLILLNLPISLRQLLQPPAFACALPHFIDRLEPQLQKQLHAVWAGYRPGDPCPDRVEKQLMILEENDISLTSFQMPPPSLFRRARLIRKLKRASRA